MKVLLHNFNFNEPISIKYEIKHLSVRLEICSINLKSNGRNS